MAEYTMQEVNDLNHSGKTLLYPRMIIRRCCDTDELSEWMAEGSTFDAGEIRGMLHRLFTTMARRMADASIEVGGINFRADKALVDEVNSRCRLERSPQRFTRHISKYSPAERLALAQRFLESHAVLTVGDYVELTGLGRTVASMELRSWLKLPGSGLDFSGRGSHRVYVKKREE